MIDQHQPGGDRSTRSRRLVALTFGVLAIVATACVWAGLSLTDVLNVVRHR